MKAKTNKMTSRADLLKILNRIYRSLRYSPLPRRRMKAIPVESDWNWHYDY